MFYPTHRRIVTSTAYRRAVAAGTSRAGADPEGRLLSRRRPIRLEAEAIRDAMLAAAGRLQRGCTGRRSDRRSHPGPSPPGARIPIRPTWPTAPRTWRRSVYAFTKRSVSNPFAEVFDAPDPTAACGRRNTTTVPTQALTLLNDPFVSGVRRDLARRLAREAGPGDADRAVLGLRARPRPPAARRKSSGRPARSWAARGTARTRWPTSVTCCSP